MKQILLVVLFVLAILMAHSSASACSDLNGDGVVNVADFLIFVNDFGKTVSCDHVSKIQLVIQNQFNDAVWDTSRNAEGVLTITITKKPPPPPSPPPVTTPGNTDDRAVLVEFYNAMGGENWTRRRNWLSDRPLNEWWGVSTTEDGRVDSLQLAYNNLSGPIPSGLGNLSNLKVLTLVGNGLSGPIPESLGNLQNLVFLRLEESFSEPIPESLGNLQNLKTLVLGKNLSGPIPESLGNLTKLEYLVLGTTNNVGSGSDIRGYDIRNNLSGPIPESLGNLQNLKELHLYRNNLSGSIPSSLGNLRNLKILFATRNNLSGPIPESLGNLHNLRRLNLGDNLSGPIPESLSSLTKLEYLILNGDGLCLPVSLYDWTRGIPNSSLDQIPDCN